MDIRQQSRAFPGTVERAEIDAGLRSYMLRVYNYMASGLALTGIVAYVVSESPQAMHAIFGTPLYWLVLLAPLGLVFFLSARITRMQ
ncbi:MAG TPA: Bax inhibitor-1 family protein, partial [Stellaceae bacterium]|nr:Bax inhibitor-1 family protein [Stellaceae bacterium]